MLVFIKFYLRQGFHKLIDNTMLTIVLPSWKRSLENRIDFEKYDPALSRKIDVALDAEGMRR